VLDPRANDAAQLVIATPTSRIGLFIIPTDEELMIARHTLTLLGERKAGAERSETMDYRPAVAGTLRRRSSR
jgi:hypothetical protein